MAHVWPPFSGLQSKRFAYEAAFKWLAEQNHTMSKKNRAVGRDWVARKIEFCPDARYQSASASHAIHQDETWFVPLRKNKRGRTLRKVGEAAFKNTMTAIDTVANPIPPGFYNPADPPGLDELHGGSNISKHLTGEAMGWTDMLAYMLEHLDADTHEGGKIMRRELKKELRLERMCWLAVRQRSIGKLPEKRVFRYARVDIGPASLTTMEEFQNRTRSTPFINLGEAWARGKNGQRFLWADRAIIGYKRLSTDADLASADTLREDCSYQVRSDPNYGNDAYWHQVPGDG